MCIENSYLVIKFRINNQLQLGGSEEFMEEGGILN